MSRYLDGWAERRCLGERVRITLDYDQPDAMVEGVLIALDDEGEATVDTDEGPRRCWPVLTVELL